MAHIEIFILNYNGSRFLPECLQSLNRVVRGEHTVEISVVDNNSTDESRSVVTLFEGIHFIQLADNFGFSKGNNLGVWARLRELRATGRDADYVCFLNNDTRVSESWLLEALRRFELSPKAGIVGSKALFYDSFVEVELAVLAEGRDALTDSVTSVVLRDWRHSSNLHNDQRRTKWLQWNAGNLGDAREVNGTSRVLFAVKDRTQEFGLDTVIENRGAEPVSLRLTVQGDSQILSLPPNAPQLIGQVISPMRFRSFVQNAGSFVTPTWEAGDIGMFLLDEPGIDDSREVAAVCGVSMFIKRDLYERLGGFDETFFAYFEDTDLSLRARVTGAECWYAATSRLYHVHCGSGGEWSPYFNFNVSFSHLVFGSRWMGLLQFVRKCGHVLRFAWRELRTFADDQNLETKPNLRTLVRVLKNPSAIVRGRWYHLRNRRRIVKLVEVEGSASSCS